MARRLVPLVVLVGLLAAPGVGAASPPGHVEFPHGVASGQVGSTSAVLWTRTAQAATVKVEVSDTAAFRGVDAFQRTLGTTADDDFIAEVTATGLQPATTYYYRWRHGHRTSETGTFRTAPDGGTGADVRFAITGDSDGTPVDGAPFFNAFEVLDRVREDAPDFFVYLGDTIYSDSGLRPGGPATSLADYREAYRWNREIAALPELLASTSTYAMWDDHEVYNDFDGQTVDPTRYANGREAFLEWMPVTDDGLLHDETCAGDPMFRTFSWGADVDLFVLDERSCRSADASAVCGGDLAPTLPSSLRTAFGLSASPPPGCLDAIFDPARTMLGPVQKAAFESALAASQARFKFVINEVPIQQYYALPYDRWEGYGAERNELLAFIRDNAIDNVLFLTTDNHANFVNQVAIDVFTDPTPIADEVVTGPIATNTLEVSAFNLLGASGVAALNAVLSLVGVDCRDLDSYAYALVEVDHDTGTATITLKDDQGNVLVNQSGTPNPCVHVYS